MQVYNGGGMTTYPKQLMMAEVKERIEKIGIPVYDPASQPFNDKKAVANADIATKIVAKDTEAIYNSNIRLMNTQEDNLGTCIEAGIIKGYADYAQVVFQIIEDMRLNGSPESDIVDLLFKVSEQEIVKEYIPYHTDIRIHNSPETGFKRSVGFHQFLRGTNLLLGEYHKDFGREDFDGFFSLNDALEQLEEAKEKAYLNDESPIHINVNDDGRLNVTIKELEG